MITNLIEDYVVVGGEEGDYFEIVAVFVNQFDGCLKVSCIDSSGMLRTEYADDLEFIKKTEIPKFKVWIPRDNKHIFVDSVVYDSISKYMAEGKRIQAIKTIKDNLGNYDLRTCIEIIDKNTWKK